MNQWHKTLTAVLLAAAAGTHLFQSRQASGLREESEVLNRRQTNLAAELRQLRQQRDEAVHCLATIEQENGQITTIS